jgi:hypothetical protein
MPPLTEVRGILHNVSMKDKQFNTYIVVGTKLPYPKKNQDFCKKIEPYTDSVAGGKWHKDGLAVLSDGENGKYVFIGKIIEKTGKGQGFSKPVKIENKKTEFKEVASLIRKTFDIARPEVGLWVVSHYRLAA